MSPLVSVIMSVYNAEKYIEESIESVLNQTYTNLEFIIINDGSSDSSLDKIKKYLDKDERIVLINNLKNKGLIFSLNKGIEVSNGKYIARMDADDISLKNRIEEQVEFMEKNEEIVLSGTAHTVFLDGLPFINKDMKVLTEYEDIKVNSIFDCSFVHPSIIMRSDIIKKENFKYKEEYKHAEDFGLWTEIMLKYKVSNINKPLIKYRIVKGSVTRQANRNINQRELVFKKIYKNYLKGLNINLKSKDLDMHYSISMIQNILPNKYNINEKLIYLNYLKNQFESKELRRICAQQFLKNCLYQSNYKMYRKSDYYNIIPISRIEFIKQKNICNVKQLIKKMYK